MNINEPTRKVLQDIADGKKEHPIASPINRRLLQVLLFADEHKEELFALDAAEMGNAEHLAVLIQSKGELKTLDARNFVAARLRGEKRKRGLKRTQDSIVRQIMVFQKANELMQEGGLTQSEAIQKLMDDGYVTSFSSETVRSDFTRGKAEFRKLLKAFGLPIGPALQKS